VVTTHSYGPFDVSFYNTGDTYTQYSTTYTGAANWTTAQMDDVGAMIQIWDSGITNTTSRQIKMNLMWSDAIGGAGGINLSEATGDGTNAYTYPEKLWRQGTNAPHSGPDAFIVFNSTVTWNTGPSAPTWNTLDFRSVLVHEIGHSLGFMSMYSSTDGTWWSGGLSEWDKHLRDAASGGNQAKVGSSGSPSPFNVTANPVYFDGVYANAANGGNRVKIEAPSPFSDGSSLTHLDENTFPNALMSPVISYGNATRQPTLLEWQMMKDLGWSLDTADKTWSNSTTSLQWGSDNNWTITGVPDATHTVSFTNLGLSSGDTIILGGNHSTGYLLFDTTATFTIGGTSGTLTIATGSINRSAASAGTQTIARPVALGANAVWDIAGSGSLIASGAISGNYSLEKRGTGTLNLSGANTYAGLTRVRNGTLTISGGSTASNTFDVISGATLSITGGTYSISNASITNAGILNIAAGCNFTDSGNLTGTGNTIVNGTLTVSSISQNTLTLGIGSRVTIQPIPGGPLGYETIRAVPEPGMLIMLLTAVAAACALRKSARWIGR
jgi:autotransporter-associated beta strand protein